MYASKNLSLKFVVRFAWKPLLIFFIYSSILTLLFELADWRFLAFPFVPIGLVGTAVAFYVGFKNNSSYERLWEARKLWGSIVNLSRTLATYVCDYLEPSAEIKEDKLEEHKKIIIYRHLAYINALRIQLRRNRIWDSHDDAFASFVDETPNFKNHNLIEQIKQFIHPDEVAMLEVRTNTATHILKKQSDHLKYLSREGVIDSYKHVEIGRLIQLLFDQQGACERIKTYPFPRQYAYFSEVFVWILALILPFGLLGELSKLGDAYVWFTIPMSMLISWIFNVTETVGDASENPFENSVNDIPMTAICRTIEIDLKEMLGEQDVPPKLKPENNILM